VILRGYPTCNIMPYSIAFIGDDGLLKHSLRAGLT
jgi:hypothetical protein